MSWEVDFHQSGRIFIRAGQTLGVHIWNLYPGGVGRFVEFDVTPLVEGGHIQLLSRVVDLTSEWVLRHTLMFKNVGSTDTVFIYTWVIIPRV